MYLKKLPTLAMPSFAKLSLVSYERIKQVWEEQGGKVLKLPNPPEDLQASIQNREQWQLVYDQVRESSSYRDYFSYKDYDFAQLIEPIAQKFFIEDLGLLDAWIDFYCKWYKRNDVHLVLGTSAANLQSIAFYRAAKLSGLTTFCYTHGFTICENPIIAYTDLWDIDYCFFYNANMANLCAKLYERREHRQAQMVGLGMLPEVSRAKPKKTLRRVLYLSTGLVGDKRYLAGKKYAPFHYVEIQRKVFDIFAKHSDIQVSCKLFHGNQIWNPIEQYIEQLGCEHIDILPSNIPAESYLEDADLYVMDYPGSTLAPMLCTENPAIVLYDHDFWPNIQKFMHKSLKQRIELYEDRELFFEGLERMLSKEQWALPEVDDQFIDSFLFSKDREEPAEKFVKLYRKGTFRP